MKRAIATGYTEPSKTIQTHDQTHMRRTLLFILLGLLLLAGLLWLAIQERHQIAFKLMTNGAPPALLEAANEGSQDNPDLRWLDDYFLIVTIDPQTFAIVEPRYEQQNINYLIVGHDIAILFDAGSGLRDVAAAAATLTDKQITFVPSHLHYDHIGKGGPFARTALIDLPHLRERSAVDPITGKTLFTPSWEEHLGSAEGLARPELIIDEWLAPGSVISLGGRALRVLHTPGHTSDSVSLFDTARGYLFSGDFIYQGPLYAFLPNSSLEDYARGASTLLGIVPEDVRVYGAHRTGPQGVPVLNREDIAALADVLERIRSNTLESSGRYPVSYPVNDRISLLAEPAWLQEWE